MTTTRTTANLAGISESGPLADAVMSRDNIFHMTDVAEAAVLRPKETGRWSHAWRAAMAARIAILNDMPELAERYAVDADEFVPLADPFRDSEAEGFGSVVAFMDKVACQTRDIAAEDIALLQDTGIEDADIVRLCELNAFLAYQIRVIRGLQLMKGGQT